MIVGELKTIFAGGEPMRFKHSNNRAMINYQTPGKPGCNICNPILSSDNITCQECLKWIKEKFKNENSK